TRAAQSFDHARLGIHFAGVDRAAYAAERSPLPSLAAILARRGRPEAAWQRWEANLARGLLDDLSARLARPLSAEEIQREQQLTGRIQLLDKQLAALRSAKNSTDTGRQQADQLQQLRDAAWGELTQFEAELSKPEKYGPAAGQVYERSAIQALLPAQTALVGW